MTAVDSRFPYGLLYAVNSLIVVQESHKKIFFSNHASEEGYRCNNSTLLKLI